MNKTKFIEVKVAQFYLRNQQLKTHPVKHGFICLLHILKKDNHKMKIQPLFFKINDQFMIHLSSKLQNSQIKLV